MMKTVYSALAAVALLAGTASFAADQTTAPATAVTPSAAPVAATATSSTTPAVATPAKATVKDTSHATKVKGKEAAAPEASASSTAKK